MKLTIKDSDRFILRQGFEGLFRTYFEPFRKKPIPSIRAVVLLEPSYAGDWISKPEDKVRYEIIFNEKGGEIVKRNGELIYHNEREVKDGKD
jgi:hypothetical protein